MDLIEATRLAKGMMASHGLIEKGWRFEFDNAVKRLGSCRHHQKLLTMSRKFASVATEAQVRETMLHEIAHAICLPGEGHGRIWKAKYRAIGGTGQRTATNPYLATEDAETRFRWVGTCPAGHTSRRAQRPVRVMACGRCSKVFKRANVMSWTFDGEQVHPAHVGPRYHAEWIKIFGGDITPGQVRRVMVSEIVRQAQDPEPWRPKVGEVVRVATADPRYLGRDLTVWKVGPKRAHFLVDGFVLMVPHEQIIPTGGLATNLGLAAQDGT